MKSISLCIIVKNEQQSLQQCILSIIDVVDEIIVVDTGSTDGTKEIAARFTDKIYDFKWCDDFSAARNFAFSKATKDFIMWLDADDFIMEEDRKKLLSLKEELTSRVDGVMLKYHIGGGVSKDKGLFYYRQRIVKRLLNTKWQEPVHEYLPVVGNVITRDISVTHIKLHSSGDRNIQIYEAILAEGKKLSTRGMYYYAKELYERKRVKEAVEYFEKFLERKDSWKEDRISTCFFLVDCYQTLEDRKKELQIILKSFEYGKPRAELCCCLGRYYIEEGDYKTAIFWYTLVTTLEVPKDTWGFILYEYWNFVPYMQLCFLHDRLGEYKKAYEYNELAAKYRPDSEKVIYNRNYLLSVI